MKSRNSFRMLFILQVTLIALALKCDNKKINPRHNDDARAVDIGNFAFKPPTGNCPEVQRGSIVPSLTDAANRTVVISWDRPQGVTSFSVNLTGPNNFERNWETTNTSLTVQNMPAQTYTLRIQSNCPNNEFSIVMDKLVVL